MGYESEIQFVLDTICPWTYIAKRRLAKALSTLPSDCPVKFSTVYQPYQLFPGTSQEGEGKYEWYKNFRYDNDEEKMQKFTAIVSAYGEVEGIRFKFGGTVANTTHAHRLIQHFQEKRGFQIADRIIDSLYRQYFEEERHPSSDETLLRAATEAGIGESEAKAFIAAKDEGLFEVRRAFREQAGNQIDVVPYLTFVGKRRDFELDGAREVSEYVSALNKVIDESV